MCNSASKTIHTHTDVHLHINAVYTQLYCCGAIKQELMLPAVFQRILGSNSLFKAVNPPTLTHSSSHALRLCYSVIMVSKHTPTSCSAHFKLTNGWPINCTAGLHPPQNNQTNFDHPHTHMQPNIHQLGCFSALLPILINFPYLFSFENNL